MKVKYRMTPNPITATPETTHREAVDLLRQYNIRRLPILDREGRLVGIVVAEDLYSAQPSPATTLSIYEIYTLLDKLTLAQIMTTPVYAVDEDCGLASAAHFMAEKKISCLPVMRGEELVGIITETDIFKAFVEVLGGGEPGLRVDLRVADRVGMLAEITRAFADSKSNIVSLTTFGSDVEGLRLISIKERGADVDEIREALSKIEGVEILEIRPSGQDQLLTFGKEK
ncbi:MAG TPA: CBS domain-containing protein [Chloroflexi bacterium]|nr:CBS domain-containing protein [Chloroflexota bacterium]